MPTFLSPGVITREIDLSLAPSGVGPTRPVFVGTAKKGPLNKATFITTAQQAIDTFGEPFSESYLMYAVLAYLEEGNQCYVVRVGVKYEEGQDAALSAVAIDTSGNKVQGWGRIPLFSGVDYGKINLRPLSADVPYVFHGAANGTVDYSDFEVSDTDGPTTATLTFSGTYTGSIDDSYVVHITGNPDDTEDYIGATYQIVRNSDNVTVASGTAGVGAISIGDGLSVQFSVSAGRLAENDTFRFTVRPNNTKFSVSVEFDTATEITITPGTYSDIDDFIDDMNALVSAEDYNFVKAVDENGVEFPQIRTADAGRSVQIMSTEGWTNEVGTVVYAYDVPRSHVVGLDVGPYKITSNNNRIAIDVVPSDVSKETADFEFSIPTGLTWEADDIVPSITLAGVKAGDTHFFAETMLLPGGSKHVIIVVDLTHMFDQLKLMATFSNIKTLRFAEEIGVSYPYTVPYRGFYDARPSLPDEGTVAGTPATCDIDSNSADCIADTDYYENVVGWLVAPSAGTWVDGYKIDLVAQTQGLGDLVGRYSISIRDANDVQVEYIDDVSFDPASDRYIANVVNPGSPIGGTNGNSYINWEERPSYINNDVNVPSTYEVRLPSQFSSREFIGTANGIPTDPEFSSDLDAAVIGNPNDSSGIYAAQNAETFDVNVLATPGFNSGAIIAQCLQLCEGRGDVLYLVDPPFGLKPQQVTDWHNGMLNSSLTAAINSSYGALYWSWIKIFDQFNSQDIWVPPSGHIAAVFSRTARDAEQWFAPAGNTRGRILTAIDVEYTPSQGERDLLYGSKNAVNPIVSFPQDGVVVFGQRTLQRAETALSRVNVRMLLSYIKKNLAVVLRNFLFEPNDTVLWPQVQTACAGFLADIQSRRGLDGYKVIVDESNNTPERRDRNQLVVTVLVKPTRAVEFVVLNLVVLRSSASFNAEEVLAAGGLVTRSN